MTGIIIGAVIFGVAIAVGIFIAMRRSGGVKTSGGRLRHLADVRGWHFSRPDESPDTYGLSGDSVLRGADGSSLDWRIRWHLRVTRSHDKDKTEFKCADVALAQGWVFIEPRAHAGEIKARQRAASTAASTSSPQPGARKCAWKEALAQSHEIPVGSEEFLGRYFVCATVKESVVRRLLPQRMQKTLMGAPHAGHLSIRLGIDGIVITCPADYEPGRIEEIVKLGEILVSSVAQEQTASIVA